MRMRVQGAPIPVQSNEVLDDLYISNYVMLPLSMVVTVRASCSQQTYEIANWNQQL